MSDATSESGMPNTNYMKLLSIMDDIADRRITNGASYGKRGNDAGASVTGGGMSMSSAGTPNTIGTTAITIATETGASKGTASGVLRV